MSKNTALLLIEADDTTKPGDGRRQYSSKWTVEGADDLAMSGCCGFLADKIAGCDSNIGALHNVIDCILRNVRSNEEE